MEGISSSLSVTCSQPNVPENTCFAGNAAYTAAYTTAYTDVAGAMDIGFLKKPLSKFEQRKKLFKEKVLFTKLTNQKCKQ